MGRCGASRRVGATGGSHGGAAGQSRPLQAASSHRGVASLSATLLRTSAANFSFASELDSCRGGKQRMPDAHRHLRRARLLLRARVRTRQQAAAGGTRFCESLRCGPPPLKPPPPKVAAQSLHLSGLHLSGLHLQASWSGPVGSLVGAAYQISYRPLWWARSQQRIATPTSSNPTEKVYNGICSHMADPGHLSHLERPNYDFATYLNQRIRAART